MVVEPLLPCCARKIETRKGSQSKMGRRGGSPGFFRIAGVKTLYSIIHIWNLKGRATMGERNGFFLSRFGFQVRGAITKEPFLLGGLGGGD